MYMLNVNCFWNEELCTEYGVSIIVVESGDGESSIGVFFRLVRINITVMADGNGSYVGDTHGDRSTPTVKTNKYFVDI